MEGHYAPMSDNKGPLVLALSWTTASIALIVVVLRFYARISFGPNVGFDDISMGIAMGVSLFSSVANVYQVRNGFGKHIYYLSRTEISNVLRWTVAAELASGFIQFFLRHSICLFLLKLLSGTKRWFKNLLFFAMLLNLIATIITLVCYLVQCIPFEGIWRPEIHASCFSKEILTIVTKMLGALGCIIDFICALLPIYVVVRLQMPTRTKVSLSILLGLGLLTAACSIGNIVAANIQTEDPTYDLYQVEIWAMMIENGGITVGSIPTLRKLVSVTAENLSKQTSKLRLRMSLGSSHLVSRSAHDGGYRGSRTQPHSIDNISQNSLVPRGQVKKTTEVEVELSRVSNFDSK